MKKKKGRRKNKQKKIKIRKLWNINPKTKVKEKAGRYSRVEKKKELKDLLKEFL